MRRHVVLSELRKLPTAQATSGRAMSLKMIRWLLLMLAACVTLAGQTFEKAKMYVEQEHKLKLHKVAIDVQDEALVVTGKSGKYSSIVRIPYAEITEIEYEQSKHRRWKTGVLLSPLALLSKGKKHWFAVIRGEEETVFQLDKSNFSKILAVVESKTGKKVKMVAGRG